MKLGEAIEHFNKIIQESAWLATPEMNDQRKQLNYSLEIREKLKENRRLRKTWQRILYPLDKLVFNRASKELN